MSAYFESPFLESLLYYFMCKFLHFYHWTKVVPEHRNINMCVEKKDGKEEKERWQGYIGRKERWEG